MQPVGEESVLELESGFKPGSVQAIKSDWSQHWKTGLAAMLGFAVCVSVIPSIFSIFILPLQAEYGWTRAQIGLAQSGTLIAAFIAPFIGIFIDRYGTHRFIIGATAGMSCLYLALAAMPGELWYFYLCMVLLQIVGLPTSGLGYSRVIGASFTHSLGFSLACGRAGLALGAISLPPGLYLIISAFGFRAGYMAMAAAIFVFALLPAIFWIRDTARGQVSKIRPSQWIKLIGNRRVLLLAVVCALSYVPILAITSQLQPLLIEKDIAPGMAAGLVGLVGVSTFAGTMITGVLIDRFWAPLIGFLVMSIAAAGLVILFFEDGSLPLAVVALLFLGLAHGAETDLVSYLIVRYFGLKGFGQVYGLVVFTIALAVSAGFYGVGYLRDTFGTYDQALLIAAAMLFSAGLLYLTLGPYPQDAEA